MSSLFHAIEPNLEFIAFANGCYDSTAMKVQRSCENAVGSVLARYT